MTAQQILILSNYLSQSFRNNVSILEVKNFKVKWCKENSIISEIMRSQLNDYLKAPILDIGAGLGDIAFNVFPNKVATLLDINEVTVKDYPLSINHTRITSDFFDYKPNQKFNTLLISHSLQFIDEDIYMLNSKIEKFDAKYILLVINDNFGFMKELLNWVNEKVDSSNPEIDIEGFPHNYSLEKKINFSATLACPTYELLAEQISYLMVVDYKTVKSELVSFLKERLKEPSFPINQSIKVFIRNGNK